LHIEALSWHVGAEVSGVDLAAELPDDTFEKIDEAYNRYSVLVFRDQKLTPEQQIAFARRFGELEISPRTEFALSGYPEILVLSNIVENGKPIGTFPTPRRHRAGLCCTPLKSRSRTAVRSAILYSRVPPPPLKRCLRTGRLPFWACARSTVEAPRNMHRAASWAI